MRLASGALLAISAALAATVSLAAWAAAASRTDDHAAIRATALDYAEGWYAADAARMERALHPDLAKRIVRQREGRFALESMSAAQLVDATGRGGGQQTPVERQEKDVQILDVFENAASVRLTMDGWVDYMHLARWEGRWVIVNVLWELEPSESR